MFNVEFPKYAKSANLGGEGGGFLLPPNTPLPYGPVFTIIFGPQLEFTNQHCNTIDLCDIFIFYTRSRTSLGTKHTSILRS